MINNTLFVVLFNPLHLPIFDITLMLISKCGAMNAEKKSAK